MTKSTITREQLLEIIETDHVQCGEASYLARMALAAMASEHKRNPVLAYADSYRDMAKQGVESVPIWSVITDLERNIAPLYRHAQPAPEYPETLPCPVLLEPGMRFGKGVKTRLVLDAIQRRADQYAELEAMTQEERAEYDANIEAFKAMLPQPAPVVPENCVTAEHRRVIEMLLNVCGVAFELADDSCQQDVDGEDCHVVPDDAFQKLSDALDEIENTLPTEDIDRPDVFLAWSAMPRAALKSLLQAGNSTAIPDGYVMVPMRLTAENGAKGALSGEFSETKFVNCPECFGDDECETCDGSGRFEITVPVTWTTIKEIWAKGVEHFAAAPQSPGGDHATVPGKWIPVSERLPEDSGRYWCYVEEQNDLGKSHYQWNCSWNGDRWWVESEGGGIVTHWMPLPAAPQEVKGE